MVNLEVVVYRQLKTLGVPSSMLGYQALKEAILLVLKEPSLRNGMMTKTVYPEVAKIFNSTPVRIERCMRTAIEYVYNNTEYDILARYFGNTFRASTGKLTNTQFIMGVVEYIKMEVFPNECDF